MYQVVTSASTKKITLDGMTVQDMEAALGVKVTMAETMREVLD